MMSAASVQRQDGRRASGVTAVAVLLFAAACGPATTIAPVTPAATALPASAPTPDPRVDLRAGLTDPGEATWNLRLLSATPTPREFVGGTNSDLAFTGNYAIQGSFKGYQVWDITNPAQPSLAVGHVCPASQSDVSVYRNLLFVSGEDLAARLDCGTQGVSAAVSGDRLRGLRIFDISDIRNPKNVGNVQTCRGSHTHTVVVDPNDRDNVYVYISGSAGVRSEQELPGCSAAPPSEDPNSALFRIEVIKVPLANPERAAIVSSPRIFAGLVQPASHGLAPADLAEVERAQARGEFVIVVNNQRWQIGGRFAAERLDSIVRARGGSGAPTAADSAALRRELPNMVARDLAEREAAGPRPGPTQCHDITVYPEVGLAGGACEGYGLLIDISNPVDPRRIYAAADSNFSYWHSATFNNDGTKLLFSDEWGGGMQAKCRASDPEEWGADAIFTIAGGELQLASYYKLPAAQTAGENCVAHNGSMIPVPGRDVMVQAWYQGGISVFDFTDATNPVEIAFFDRGPIEANEPSFGGSWSAYWYNGVIVSSEIARGLDIMELTPSPLLSQNEIDAAKSVKLDYFNPQSQPRFVWPATFALARAYVDQLERANELSAARIAAVRQALAGAESASGSARQQALAQLAMQLASDATGTAETAKVRTLASAVRALADGAAIGE